jgi:hypothetical protein
MKVYTIEEYLELYHEDYDPFLVNKLAVPVDPLGGNYHMDKRKIVDREKGTVTLYTLEEEAEWNLRPKSI